MAATQWAPVHFFGTAGTAPVVLICEHACFLVPPEFDGLGLDADTAKSHAAGDIGALNVAKGLSARLSAPLVFGGVSRLIYDCNRPLSAPDCIPAKSEIHGVPGNEGLTAAERQARFDLVHEPFHIAANRLIATQNARVGGPIAIVTVHSFTACYHGQRRDLDLGFLCDGRPALSEAATRIEQGRGKYRVALNQPYDASDGVTYSLVMHADDLGFESTMIEIRNDLIQTGAGAETMAAHLADTLAMALGGLGLKMDHADCPAGRG